MTAGGWVLMHATDQPVYDAMSQVVAASLKKVGINVDDNATDWGTVVQRRTSRETSRQGRLVGFLRLVPGGGLPEPSRRSGDPRQRRRRVVRLAHDPPSSNSGTPGSTATTTPSASGWRRRSSARC